MTRAGLSSRKRRRRRLVISRRGACLGGVNGTGIATTGHARVMMMIMMMMSMMGIVSVGGWYGVRRGGAFEDDGLVRRSAPDGG